MNGIASADVRARVPPDCGRGSRAMLAAAVWSDRRARGARRPRSSDAGRVALVLGDARVTILITRHSTGCETRYWADGTHSRGAPQMLTLTIDGQTISVAPGATILDAARQLDLDVPTLCWYPKLPIVGNCRICLVSLEVSQKLLPACATPAADGMRVTTESAAAVKNRQAVLSLLLERYPAEEIPAD